MFEQMLGLLFQIKAFFVISDPLCRIFVEPSPGELTVFFVRLEYAFKVSYAFAMSFSQNTAPEDDLLPSKIQPCSIDQGALRLFEQSDCLPDIITIERFKDLPHIVTSGKEARVLKGPSEKPFYYP